jgi:hypothetical protein|tara:strand:- start:2632 stop:2883 length:252 start_codon:yes stop_codon:yes gene_type:complete
MVELPIYDDAFEQHGWHKINLDYNHLRNGVWYNTAQGRAMLLFTKKYGYILLLEGEQRNGAAQEAQHRSLGDKFLKSLREKGL